jgi:hypothetical protein
MYDLGLGQIHTFAIGKGSYVVHNCPPDADLGGANTIRIRHYTKRKGLEGIQESGTIEAGDKNLVYAELARRKPLAPRTAEDRCGLDPGHGRDYVETDVDANRVSDRWNPRAKTWELQIEGDIDVMNARFVRRLE